jgi:hypothetical protein
MTLGGLLYDLRLTFDFRLSQRSLGHAGSLATRLEGTGRMASPMSCSRNCSKTILKVAKITIFLLASSVISGGIASAEEPLQVASLGSDYRAKEARLLRTREISSRPVHLTRLYGSMMGPQSSRGFQLHEDHESPYLWVRRLKVDTMNEEKELDSPEFLCHAWLTADAGASRGNSEYPSLFLTISQGMEDMQFPDGFAAMFDNRMIPRVACLSHAVNNNDREIDKEVHFRATIDYLDDAAAKELGIKRLVSYMLHSSYEVTDVAGGGHQHGAGLHPEPGMRIDHWMVPPGRQVLKSPVRPRDVPADGNVHFVKLHLHPYGRSVSLWDKTDNREVWTGSAENHPTKAFLTSTDTYSSTTGFPVYKDHEYELTTIYDNPTDHDIDAMAVLRLYVHSTELPANYVPAPGRHHAGHGKPAPDQAAHAQAEQGHAAQGHDGHDHATE